MPHRRPEAADGDQPAPPDQSSSLSSSEELDEEFDEELELEFEEELLLEFDDELDDEFELLLEEELELLFEFELLFDPPLRPSRSSSSSPM